MNARLPDALADALTEERARAIHEFSPYEKMRLSIAARVAAGMCANPGTFSCPNWEGEAARGAMRVADRILTLHVTGGC